MVQLNLLPDIKLEYVRARRTQRLVAAISILASTVMLAIFIVLLLFVDVAQKKNLSDLDKDIKKYSTQLTSTPDLNRILTVQNQLNSLPNLDSQKPTASRLFDYLTQLTPDQASINNLQADYTQNTMTITGTADSLDIVNTYVDTLKFTKYQIKGNTDQPKAFSNVVLSSFNRDSHEATYTITLTFDPAIFSVTNEVTLTVPHIITTRSEIDKPKDLFTAKPTGGNQ